MMFFDPMYLLIVGPGLLLGLWASSKVKRAFQEYSQVGIRSRASGAEVARRLLRASGITDVQVEPHEGWLSDHYHPIDKVVRLSPPVYHGRSVAAVGIAAHEVGHAIQHAERYALMSVRQTLVGPAKIGSSFSYIAIIAGFFLQAANLIWVGILLFTGVVAFQLVTLPVEWNASTRAKRRLVEYGIVTESESDGVKKVLNAAALTYLAALISSILTLLYFVLRFTGIGRE
jgi:hypothetical protein